MIHRQLIRPELKVMDVAAGRVEAVLSTEDVDRDGDIIRQAYWDFTDFLKHPVLVASHDYYSLRSQIGEWEDVRVVGKKLLGTARYYVGEGNEEADWGFNLARKGRAAFSVGFLPDMDKAKPLETSSFIGAFEFKGQKLLEASQVVIPSNATALQRMKGAGLDPIVAQLVEEALEEDGEGSEQSTTGSLGEVTALVAEAIWAHLQGYISKAPEEELPESHSVRILDDRALAGIIRSAVKQAIREGLYHAT